jgi:hypothetical protein
MKNRTKRFRGGDEDVNKCMNKMCNEKEKDKSYDESTKMFEKLLEEEKKRYKEEEKKMSKGEKEKLKKYFANREEFIKKRKDKSHKKTEIKQRLDICRESFCNKGCVGTKFEEGNPDTLPKLLEKRYKTNKFMLDLFKKDRKKIFGTKKNVLVDNFYEGLKPDDITKMKKDGAISGCAKDYVKMD